MDLSTSYTIKAQVTGQDQIGGLKTGLDKLKTSSNNAAGAMGKLKNAAGQAFGALKALAPAIGIAGMGKLVNDTLTLGDQLGKLSEQTGISAGTLDKFRQASDLAGVDFAKVSKSLGIMSKNMADFNEGKGLAVDTLEILDVDPFDHATRSFKSMDKVLFEVMDAISKFPAGYDKVNMAMDIFGGKGKDLIPLLNMQSEGVKALTTAFSDKLVDRIEDFNDDMTQLGEKFNFLKFSLTESLLPALELAVGALTKVGEFLKNLPKPIQSAIIAFGLLAPAIIALAPVLAALIVSFKIIAKIKIATVLAGIVAKFAALKAGVIAGAAAFAPFLPGALIGAAIIGLGVLIFKFKDQIIGGFKAAGEFITNFFIGVRDAIGNIINNIAESLKPLTNFIGNIFNNAMDLARNAFNRLPNIVQEAIKFATAPLRRFIKLLQNILNMLGRVRGAKAKPPKSPRSTSTPKSTSTPRSSSNPKSTLPRTYGYEETDMSPGNIGTGYVGFTSSAGIPEIPKNTRTTSSNNTGGLSVTKLPSGGYSITQKPKSRKSPNINIQTGNVVQMNNTNYVTTKDLENAVQSGVAQTMNYIQAGGVTHYL
tara:strand:+ start:615 stop:2393 length:1779 start_codon:yes stop_codon:yes gene_type:complete